MRRLRDGYRFAYVGARAEHAPGARRRGAHHKCDTQTTRTRKRNPLEYEQGSLQIVMGGRRKKHARGSALALTSDPSALRRELYNGCQECALVARTSDAYKLQGRLRKVDRLDRDVRTGKRCWKDNRRTRHAYN